MNQDSVNYVKSVLLGEDGSTKPMAARAIHYGTMDTAPSEARLVIVPSPILAHGTYGTRETMPVLPVARIDDVPILYGSSEVVTKRRPDGEEILLCHADIIASAFFMLTRYEEIVNREQRDTHGRFLAEYSFPFRAGFLDTPIVDEYGRLLRRWLKSAGVDIPEPSAPFRVTLTHDIDHPYKFLSLRFATRASLGKVARRELDPFLPLSAHTGFSEDPYDTYDWLIQNATKTRMKIGEERVQLIFFFLIEAMNSLSYVNLFRLYRIRNLIKKLSLAGELGIHPSYEAGKDPFRLIPLETSQLARLSEANISKSRSHYLRWCEPEHYAAFEIAGISDDYTMGYPDRVGFRLGTCRPVRFFEPTKQKLTTLTVHPMAVMDATLNGAAYMDLDYEDARDESFRLIETISRHRGELVLLWHNTFCKETGRPGRNYLKRLYEEILARIAG